MMVTPQTTTVAAVPALLTRSRSSSNGSGSVAVPSDLTGAPPPNDPMVRRTKSSGGRSATSSISSGGGSDGVSGDGRPRANIPSLEECLFGKDRAPLSFKGPDGNVIVVDRNQTNDSHLDTDDDSDNECPPEKTNKQDSSSVDSSSDVLEGLADMNSKWSDAASQERPLTRPHVIDLKSLRRVVSSGGVYDDDDTGRNYRAVAWRVLVGFLPESTDEWSDLLTQQRSLYSSLCDGLFRDTRDVSETANQLRARRRGKHAAAAPAAAGPTPPIPPHLRAHWAKKGLDRNLLERLAKDLNALQMKELTETETKEIDDHELNDFVESALLLEEIRKDVVRTHPDLSFFLDPYRNLGRRRYAALERILFVWSKYNKGVRYVQGMNEIVGILYYVLANDQNEEWAVWAEADAYWLFHTLMVEMSDVFVPGMDDHDTGVQGRINAMHALLERHDPEVKEHLDEIGIEVSFYAIRWWTTLLSREFLLPDTIRLWDSMFCSTAKDNFLRYVCVAMVMTIRDNLLKSDFSACLKLLHNFPSTHIEQLLESSRALWIYESQVSVACHRGGLSLHQALTALASPPAVVMAFGFPNGTPPASRGEQFEKAKVSVEASVRNAAQDVVGRARGFYSRFSLEKITSKKAAHTATDNALALGRAKEDSSKKEEDDIYLKAILNS